MCGLAFLHDPTRPSASGQQAINTAVQKLKHRGPDEQNTTHAGHAFLGHARLSIVDVATSHQPLVTPDQRYHLVFNGEIYNFQSLRSRLEPKWAFRTQGDTEVILAGLILEGSDFLGLMEGMWAIAFWDSLSETLILSRDPLGKKPLFYQIAGHSTLWAASELPALKALADGRWQEDLNSTADYFRYGLLMPGKTIYKEVQELLPGTTMEWRPGEAPAFRRHWLLPLSRTSLSRHETLEQLQQTLENAVRKRLIADVEIGAFLSGGVDSSLIVALMKPHLKTRIKTFTIRFKEASYDESPFAQQMADFLGTEHFAETFNQVTAEGIESLITNHLGQPFADASILPTTLVSGVAASHVKVALSGDGGDELFCGYQRYQARVILNWYSRLPKALRLPFEKLIQYLPEPTVHHSRSYLKKAKLFVDAAQQYATDMTYFAPRMFTSERFDACFPDLRNLGHPASELPQETGLNDLKRMMAKDMLIYLPQDILQKVDRASMARSLEVRSPFLDTELIKLAFSLPSGWHRNLFGGKRMLRSAFLKQLPENIWNRNKQGFGIPLHHWFKGELGDVLIEQNAQGTLPLDQKALYALIKEHRSGQRDYGLQLWTLYCYSLWKKSHTHHASGFNHS
ncbi:MAG: asparagine synthase (glutamine-hydrolyzing) [Hahellaceae bacterium]|nr:asparagine synthase (glutamine-hydrolyzing) [Hahellaceae bacterium]